MSPKKKPREDLRRRAERLLSKIIKNSKPETRNSELKSADMKKLIQELQVHQVELEIQNEELRRVQAEIGESRSKYVDLYDFAPVGYFTFTETEKIVEVNLTGAELLGIERSRLLGRAFSVFVAPEFRSVFRRHCSDVLKREKRERCELKLIKQDGTFFHAQLESIAVDANKRNSTSIRSAVSDITKRKEAEEDLVQRTKELETLAENAPDVIFRVDRNLRFVFVNRKVSDFTGIPKQQFYGKTLLELGLPGYFSLFLGKKTQEVFDHQTPNEFEFSFNGHEGLQWFHAHIIPEFGINGNVETAFGIAHEITDLKRAELAYKEESSLRKSIEEALLIGIAAGDLEGRQSYVNPSFCKMVGWSKEELLGATPPFVYWPPEEIENITHTLQQVLSGEGQTATLEVRFQRKNGECFDALVRISQLKDGNGKLIGWIESIGDITEHKKKDEEIQKLNLELEQRVIERTAQLEEVNQELKKEIVERKRTEEALRNQEAILRAFFNTGDFHRSILELKEDDIVYKLPNQKIAAFFGLSVEEMAGKSLQDLGVPEKRIRFWLDRFRQCQKTGETGGFEYVLQYKGKKPWFECSFGPIEISKEQPPLFSFEAMEITDRKNAEHLSKALNDINMHVGSSLEYDEIMRKVVTEAGRAIGCEMAAMFLKEDDHWVISHGYGFPAEWVVPRRVYEEEPHAALAIKTKKPVVINDAYNDERVDREHMKKYEIRSVLVVPIFERNNPVGVIFFSYRTSPVIFSPLQVDFSIKLASSLSFAIRNAQLLKELRHRAAELENANKELESFTYSASHDLKAPLIVASGFCRRLSEQYGEKLDNRGARYLQRIQEASQHMNLLIEDLLNLSKVTTSEIKFKSINLSDVVKSIAAQLKEAQAERQVSFLIEEGLTAKGDPRLIKIALENLLSNAWKYTMKSEHPKIEFGRSKRIGDESTYFLRDNGSGFDMTKASKLFQPFQRLHKDEEFSGTGIGLATVHRIITRHGGRIWAESEVDKGTTFFFTLPS
jgi:PAS domain S-box-containing protein